MMGNIEIYGDDYGGDDGMMIMLVREATREVDTKGLGIGEVVTTVEEGAWVKMGVIN